MGFERNAAVQALNMFNGNRDSAINYLLGGGQHAAAPTATVPVSQPEPPKKKSWW
jgi:hypothetical protein